MLCMLFKEIVTLLYILVNLCAIVAETLEDFDTEYRVPIVVILPGISNSLE